MHERRDLAITKYLLAFATLLALLAVLLVLLGTLVMVAANRCSAHRTHVKHA